MEPGGPMLHSQGLFNNPYPETNQPNYPPWAQISPQGPVFKYAFAMVVPNFQYSSEALCDVSDQILF